MMGMLFKASDQAAQVKVKPFSDKSLPDRAMANEFAERSEESAPLVGEPLREPDETAELRRQLSVIEAQLEESRKQANDAEARAYERGLEEGQQLAQSLEQDRLDLLKTAAEKAQTQLDDQLAGLQALALQISHLAMAKILGNADNLADLVAQSIRYRCNQLSAELITGIRVSAEDFPDDASLAVLARLVGRTDISSDTRLAGGGCIIDLKLGRYDIGISRQWERLQSLLDELSREELSA